MNRQKSSRAHEARLAATWLKHKSSHLRLPGPDPHVARPKTHARCEAPQPSSPTSPSRFYHFLFTMIFKGNKKTHTAYLIFSSTYSRWPILSSFLLSFHPTPSPFFPLLFFLLFFCFPLFFLPIFFCSLAIFFFPSPFIFFPPLKTSEVRGPLRREA